jgi:hypothetical protein
MSGRIESTDRWHRLAHYLDTPVGGTIHGMELVQRDARAARPV